MSTSTSTSSEVTQTSALADLRKAAFLSVLPDHYYTRYHFSFIRFTTALESVSGKTPEKIHPSDVEYLITQLLDESAVAYYGTTGEPIPNHKRLPLLSHGSGKRQVLYALEQVILEFERTQSVYLPTELEDEGCRRVAMCDAEELAERFRRRE